MFKAKKIAWESWNTLEEEAIGQQLLNFDDMIADNEDMEDGQEEMHPLAMLMGSRSIETPLGIFSEDSLLKPSVRWDCWVGHTNFDITKGILDIIEEVPGVEALRAMGRYTFFIGVAKLFLISEVRKSIEQALCTYTEEEILSDPEVIEAVEKVRSQLDKEKFWSIMVTVDGSIEYVSSNEMNKSYLDNVNNLILLKEKLGGIVITSND